MVSCREEMEPDRKVRGREPAESKGHAGMIRDSDPVRAKAAGVPAVRARAAVAEEDSRPETVRSFIREDRVQAGMPLS